LRPAFTLWRIIVRSNSANAPVSWKTPAHGRGHVDGQLIQVQVRAARFEVLDGVE
jgi:hypothetical protein